MFVKESNIESTTTHNCQLLYTFHSFYNFSICVTATATTVILLNWTSKMDATGSVYIYLREWLIY